MLGLGLALNVIVEILTVFIPTYSCYKKCTFELRNGIESRYLCHPSRGTAVCFFPSVPDNVKLFLKTCLLFADFPDGGNSEDL